MLRTAALPLLALTALAGCGETLPPSAGQPGQVLGHLQSRNERISIYATADGPRFTVRSRAGQQIAEGLSIEDLRTRHPDLFRAYQTGMARQGLDASLQLPAEEARQLPADRPGSW